MQGFGWQQTNTVTVAGTGTQVVALAPSRPILEKLTIWATSGRRTIASLTFQARINRVNFGTAVTITAAIAADPVCGQGVTYAGELLIPQGVGGLDAPDQSSPRTDPFQFDMLISNGDAAAATVTLYFTAIGRDGGVHR